MTGDLDPFTEVARRFFNEFLEFKIRIESQDLRDPRTNDAERKHYEKEIARYQKAIEVLKLAAKDLQSENAELREESEKLERKCEDLRRQLNEALIRGQLSDQVRKARTAYPLTQNMSERAFQEWQKILKEIPYQGMRGEGDE